MLDQGGSNSPWSGNAANSDLARDAGVNEIGRGGSAGDNDRQGLFDTVSHQSDEDESDYEDDGDFDFGDSDVA